MTISPMRSLALAAATLLVLGGCAVPGKGEPGVAAVYRDRVITNDNVSAIYAGLYDLYSGPHAGEDLTLLLIGPEVVAFAEDLGYGMTDEQVTDAAVMWMAYAKGPAATPSPGAKEIVRVVESITYLLNEPSGEGVIALLNLVMDVEANTVTSPRYGDFTLESFNESITAIRQYIQEHQAELGPALFVAYKDVNGFSVASQPDWISGG